MRTFLTLFLFVIIAALSYWFQQDIKQQLNTDSRTDARFPDYFMENFTITSLNELGIARYTMKAAKMQHYADDDSAEFEQPLLTFNEPENHFTVQALRAEYRKDKNILHLYDKVSIHRSAQNNQEELLIQTEYLKINTQSRIAETHLPTQVTSGRAQINTVGLIFDGMQGTLKFKSRIKGIYETPQ